MQQPGISIGPFIIYYYGLIIALAVLFWYLYCSRFSSDYKISKNKIDLFFLFILPFVLVGARAYHVFSEFGYYYYFPVEIFQIWKGGLGIFGAIIGGIIGSFLFCKIYKIRYILMLSLISPPLLLVQAIGRLANYFNLEGFGFPTSLPWGIYIPFSNRPLLFINKLYFHPTFFYESILCLIAFIVFWLIKKKINKKMYFSFYLISYGIIRIITEFFRIDTWEISGFKIAYIISFLMIAFGITLGRYFYKHP